MKINAKLGEISVFIGISAGFAMLVGLLAGLGAETEMVFGTALFFAIITAAIAPLLLAGSQTREDS